MYNYELIDLMYLFFGHMLNNTTSLFEYWTSVCMSFQPRVLQMYTRSHQVYNMII